MAESLNDWLRSVRPPTAADGDWADGPDAQMLLEGIHARLDPRPAATRARRQARHRRWLAATALTAVAAVAAVVVAVVSGADSSGGRTGPTASGGAVDGGRAVAPVLPSARPAAMLLRSYSTCADLQHTLRSHTAAHVTAWGLPGTSYAYFAGGTGIINGTSGYNSPAMSTPDSTFAQAAVPSAAAAPSGTNNQETGVDEPDIVKVDGNRIVTMTGGVLRVVDGTTRSVVGSLDLTEYVGSSGAQLLVDGTHAIVLFSGGTYAGGAQYSQPSVNRSTYLFVDLSGTPTVTGSLRATGNYLDARQIGSTIRLVVDSAPTIDFPGNPGGSDSARVKANRAVVGRAPVSAWLPEYTVSVGGHTVTRTLGCDQLSVPTTDVTGASILSVYTIDLHKPDGDVRPVAVAADGGSVYATAQSLYLASNPQWYAPEAATQSTQIHRFDIRGTGAPTYLGSATVPGRLLNQYSMSDYAGSLRIATTRGTGRTQAGSVDILDADTLTRTGQVTGLAAGEQIYAARFVGAIGYLVTYRQTDPLYVLDLADPRRPRVAGSLTLTGFSSYLQDAGGGRLIGVGQESTATGRVLGMQVSLFDVADPAHPVRTGHVVEANSWRGENLDPHAFFYRVQDGLVVVPSQAYSSAAGQALVLRVSGSTLTRVGTLSNPVVIGTHAVGATERTLVVGGALWTLSSGGIQISSPTTLHRLAWLPFD